MQFLKNIYTKVLATVYKVIHSVNTGLNLAFTISKKHRLQNQHLKGHIRIDTKC